MSFLRQLRPEEVEFFVTAYNDNQDPLASLDGDVLEWVRKRLSENNVWAWCEIVVEAKWRKHIGLASMCGCSYESKEHFMRDSGYYADLQAQAMHDLQEKLDKTADELGPLITKELFDEWLVHQIQEG